VSSAKSWLCHPGVDRRAAILPADAPAEVARISPLTASTRYLEHLRWAWEQAHPEAPFAQQDITVTIPASFDPAARELTAEACKAAGFHNLTLLEEPQAALYSWIQASGGQWRKQVRHGDIILVVDVGGGTTDLSLIAVLERDGNLALQRIAVGEHILLGGDNMDLALAYGVARKLAQECGIKPIVVVPRIPLDRVGIAASRAYFPKVWIDEKHCVEGIWALDNHRREWDDDRGVWKDSYFHGKASHGYKAFETAAVALPAVDFDDDDARETAIERNPVSGY
jgi:hypothetical protein